MSKISDELLALADRIDAEMVELPKDRDGAPIHVGDTVYLMPELPRDADGSTIRVGDVVYGRWVQGMRDRNREIWTEDEQD